MEKMPFPPEMQRSATMATPTTVPGTITTVTTTDWQSGLPLLIGANVILRELKMEDAPSLLAMLTTEEVARFISPPPTTIAGFQRFIAWAHRERLQGNYACFAVVPQGIDTAVGIFQVRSLESGFGLAEWGFALGREFWGTGLFAEGARLVVDFSIEVIGAYRLEARAAVGNGRGNGALRKIGAVQEGVLRRSFLRDGRYRDQLLWSILAEDWRLQRNVPAPERVH